MAAYYNEHEPFCVEWLKNLIAADLIAPGDVDGRDIQDVKADDLKGYTQCHFFAGIGGWSYALRLAGWGDARPVWTGSCPCQPFSAAGKGEAADDERHLWPAWFSLIAECSPAIVFGEQVEAAIGWGWIDAVFSDLEGEGYACGASVLPACGVGAPHIRQRLWFVGKSLADAGGERAWRNARNGTSEETQGDSERRTDGDNAGDPSSSRGATRELADPAWRGQRRHCGDARGAAGAGEGQAWPTNGDAVRGASGMVNTASEQVGLPGRARIAGSPVAGFWSDAEWIACTDGKARPVGPGSFPLGHGIPRRTSKLRAYGNAIVPQVAAEFIIAASEAMIELDRSPVSESPPSELGCP